MSDTPPDNPEEELDLTVPLDEDFPCIKCGYNLRGVPPKNNCPECGAPIQQSLAYAQDNILCLACMRPNHTSLAICRFCNAPLSGAATTAGYFQTYASTPAKPPPPDAPPEPIPPAITPTLITCVIALIFTFRFAGAASRETNSLLAIFYWLVAAASFGFIFVLFYFFAKNAARYRKAVNARDRFLHPEDPPDDNDRTEPLE